MCFVSRVVDREEVVEPGPGTEARGAFGASPCSWVHSLGCVAGRCHCWSHKVLLSWETVLSGFSTPLASSSSIPKGMSSPGGVRMHLFQNILDEGDGNQSCSLNLLKVPVVITAPP